MFFFYFFNDFFKLIYLSKRKSIQKFKILNRIHQISIKTFLLIYSWGQIQIIIIYLKMAGSGKTGKLTQKGKAKRMITKAPKDEPFLLKKGTLRRLARKGGVQRISDNSYGGVREFADMFLVKVTRDSIVYAETGKRKTVTAMDVVYALKRNGKTLYGYSS